MKTRKRAKPETYDRPCLYCGYRFTGWADKKRHMKTHPIEERRLVCAECGRVFTRGYGAAYIRHVAAHETMVPRFWSWVDKGSDPNGCWLWKGRPCQKGYGTFYTGQMPGMPVVEEGSNKAETAAHRFSYELNVGPIPEGMEIDHLCRTPLCVRPDHLEVVTHEENMRRAFEAQAEIGTPCPHCDFVALAPAGLAVHVRFKHRTDRAFSVLSDSPGQEG